MTTEKKYSFVSSVFGKYSAATACVWLLLQPLLLCAEPAIAPLATPVNAVTTRPAAPALPTAPSAAPAIASASAVPLPQALPTVAPSLVTPAPAQAAPIFDPKTELKGAALIAALKQGGYILYMRHAISTVGSDTANPSTPLWWENCAIQRNISDAGRIQARKVGLAIRTLNIPIEEIKSSQFCRARDTAHEMGLGPIEIIEDLNHAVGQRGGFDVNVARFAQLTRKPSSGSNVLLVSHTHGSPKTEERAMSAIQEAEIVVYRPNDKGGTEPIGRILVSDWDALTPAPSTPPATNQN
jgi:phosphohistidine phosphatase SixA